MRGHACRTLSFPAESVAPTLPEMAACMACMCCAATHLSEVCQLLIISLDGIQHSHERCFKTAGLLLHALQSVHKGMPEGESRSDLWACQVPEQWHADGTCPAKHAHKGSKPCQTTTTTHPLQGCAVMQARVSVQLFTILSVIADFTPVGAPCAMLFNTSVWLAPHHAT